MTPFSRPDPVEKNPPQPAPASDEFVSRLRLLVEKMGSASALVKRAGISASGFQKYLAGAEPTRKVLIALADAARVSLPWLMTGQGTMSGEDHADWPVNHLTLLPLYRADGGTDEEAEKLVQLAFCQEWLGKYGFDPRFLMTMRVEVRNMEPTLRLGDTLIIDTRKAQLRDGEIYILRDQGSLLTKRLELQLGGKACLINDGDKTSRLDVMIDTLDVVGHVIWRGALL